MALGHIGQVYRQYFLQNKIMALLQEASEAQKKSLSVALYGLLRDGSHTHILLTCGPRDYGLQC